MTLVLSQRSDHHPQDIACIRKLCQAGRVRSKMYAPYMQTIGEQLREIGRRLLSVSLARSCHKCGKKIRKRKGRFKCKRCGFQ
jgi:tRNA(Ile2) C34 agmatinyltransferase TiaS